MAATMVSSPPIPRNVIPYANPKGLDLRCEICTKPANFQCAQCCSTYYCCSEHLTTDWHSIHSAVCDDVFFLRKPQISFRLDDERKLYKKQVEERRLNLIAYCLMIGHKFLFESRYNEALPAGTQALKFSEEHYGISSTKLVEPYLILAEANIGLGRHQEAETFLAQAQWTTIKSKHETTYAILSKLNRKLAQLFESRNDFNSALECLSQDIYYSSREYGTDHIETSGGYFYMARTYKKMHDAEATSGSATEDSTKKCLPPVHSTKSSCSSILSSDYCGRVRKVERNCHKINDVIMGAHKPDNNIIIADDLYARVITIWTQFMVNILQTKVSECEDVPDVVKEVMMTNTHGLNKAQKAELCKVLCEVQQHYRSREVNDKLKVIAPSTGRPDAIAMLGVALSLFHFLDDNLEKAKTHFSETQARIEGLSPNNQLQDYDKLLRYYLYNQAI